MAARPCAPGGGTVTATLRYERATAGYDHPVVSDVTLEVAPGEIVGLIGPNGAGKTTLLRAVGGGSRLFAGTVTVADRPVASYGSRDLARLVAVLPQAAPTAFAFTALQFVEMGRHAHVSRFGDLTAADHEAVERALDLTDTAALVSRRVDELSGGDLQRLTLAQALAQEPSILLLDEPTSHLDLNHRLQVLDVVRSLANDGLAVLTVFHDLDMAARYSDRLAVVADGSAKRQGRPAEVLTRETLREVFGVAAVIGTDPVTGSIQVLPVVRSSDTADVTRRATVLVISGSGTGAAAMRRLVLAGFGVSAGALAEGDTDAAVALALEARFRHVAQFTQMTDADIAAVSDLAREADAVLVLATPFGPDNVGNLDAILTADVAGKTVLAGSMTPEMDFTRGAALAAWERLAGSGVALVSDAAQAITRSEGMVAR